MIQRNLAKRLHPSSLRALPHRPLSTLSALSSRKPTASILPFIATLQRRAFAQPVTMVTTPSAPPPSAAAKDYGNFKVLQSFDLPYAPVNVSKWRSDKTGLTVVLGHHSCELTLAFRR